jgi:hypothetical protein
MPEAWFASNAGLSFFLSFFLFWSSRLWTGYSAPIVPEVGNSSWSVWSVWSVLGSGAHVLILLPPLESEEEEESMLCCAKLAMETDDSE